MNNTDLIQTSRLANNSETDRRLPAAILLVVLLLAFVSGTACLAGELSDRGRTLRHAQFVVIGAGCPACIRRIEGTLKMQTGIVGASVSIQRPVTTRVLYDVREIDLARILRIAADGKYGVDQLTDTAAGSTSEVVIPRQNDMFKKFSSLPELHAPTIEMP